jgi:Protein of unknown function (DUF2490)
MSDSLSPSSEINQRPRALIRGRRARSLTSRLWKCSQHRATAKSEIGFLAVLSLNGKHWLAQAMSNRTGHRDALMTPNTLRRIVCVIAVLCSCVLAVRARAQQQKEPEDPENEKQIGLWLDQGISTGLSANKSLDVEFHERFDEGASNLFEYFVQGGLAFRLRPWFTLIPIYRYQRFPGNPTIAYENRVQLNLTLSTSRGPWRPTLRTLIEGRFVDNRPASARLRFRPGIEYTLPLRMSRPPVLVVSNEFFIVPGNNPFANGGSSYTQNRFQVGVRLPIADSFSVRPYYLLQSVNLPSGWDTNEIFGISLAFRVPRKSKIVRSRQ